MVCAETLTKPNAMTENEKSVWMHHRWSANGPRLSVRYASKKGLRRIIIAFRHFFIDDKKIFPFKRMANKKQFEQLAHTAQAWRTGGGGVAAEWQPDRQMYTFGGA